MTHEGFPAAMPLRNLGHCEVADQHCLAPDVYTDDDEDDEGGPVKECFSCGGSVCENCSVRATYYNYGRKTICADCLQDHNMVEGEISYIVKLHKLAGYTLTRPEAKNWGRSMGRMIWKEEPPAVIDCPKCKGKGKVLV